MRTVVKRNLPANFKEQDRIFFQNEFQREFEEPSCVTVNRATVTSQGIVYSRFKAVQESLVQGVSSDFKLRHLITQVLRNTRVEWDESKTPAIVFDYWYKGYFHWMTDVLPRLWYLKSLGNSFSPILPLDEEASFIKKSLLPFGFEAICWIKRGEYLSLNKAMIVKHTAPTGNYNEEFIRQIRKLFRNYFGKGMSLGTNKIYVSRMKSSRRRVVNDQEVSDLLSTYGFVTVIFEDFSFEEQIQISSNAQLLIGVHGAGLTNMMFMQDQSSVFEFRPKNDATNLCYYSLASALGLHYYYQFGQPVQETQTIHDDLHINLDVLRENVEGMLSRYK